MYRGCILINPILWLGFRDWENHVEPGFQPSYHHINRLIQMTATRSAPRSATGSKQATAIGTPVRNACRASQLMLQSSQCIPTLRKRPFPAVYTTRWRADHKRTLTPYHRQSWRQEALCYTSEIPLTESAMIVQRQLSNVESCERSLQTGSDLTGVFLVLAHARLDKVDR